MTTRDDDPAPSSASPAPDPAADAAPDPAPGRLAAGVRARLSAMMFLQYFVWGAWWVTLATYLAQSLDASGRQISLAFLTQSIGALVAPFVVGLIADHLVAAPRILGVLHLAGGALLVVAGQMDAFGSFFAVLVGVMVLFMPTVSLVNAISFSQLTAPARQFPAIRAFGTLGWVVAGLAIGWLGWEQQLELERTFLLAGAAALLLGVLSFALPHTPPARPRARPTVRTLLGLDAFALLRDRTYLVFLLCSIALCIPLAFYYNFTNLYLNEIGIGGAAGLQSVSQMSEVLVLLVMPFLVRWLGFKRTLALGMAAWVLRYLLFSLGTTGELLVLVVLGLALHGLCFAFMVTGQIVTDRAAGPRLRSSAQGLTSMATYGVGLLLGSLVSGPVVDALATGDGHDWGTIWLVPAGIAAVVLVLFLVLFREQPATPPEDDGERRVS